MIVVIYQPHQNLRQHDPIVQKGYKSCFRLADKVYWLPTYLSRENPDLPILKSEQLIKFLEIKDQDKCESANIDEVLAQKLKKHQAKGDKVIFMGAGNIDNWARSIFSAESKAADKNL